MKKLGGQGSGCTNRKLMPIAATLKTGLILLFSGLADSWVTLTVGRDLGTHQPVTPRNSSYRELLCWVFYIHFIVYLLSMVYRTR